MLQRAPYHACAGMGRSGTCCIHRTLQASHLHVAPDTARCCLQRRSGLLLMTMLRRGDVQLKEMATIAARPPCTERLANGPTARSAVSLLRFWRERPQRRRRRSRIMRRCLPLPASAHSAMTSLLAASAGRRRARRSSNERIRRTHCRVSRGHAAVAEDVMEHQGGGFEI